jgi:hypothetical protein
MEIMGARGAIGQQTVGWTHFFIYAVAQNPNGEYRFHPESDIYHRKFVSAQARATYWRALVNKPEISQPGDSLEIAIVEEAPD